MPLPGRFRRALVPVAVAALVGPLAVACSDDGGAGDGGSGGAASSSTADGAGGTVDGTDAGEFDRPLRVDLIPEAIAAVEAELGGPQQYFEVNATPSLVNLFVADVDAGQVIPYVYLDGGLTSQPPSPAEGNTFSAAALDDLEVERVTERVTAELPDSIQEVFVVQGGEGGVVQYSVVLASVAGGQLLVVVSGDGAILSVEAIS